MKYISIIFLLIAVGTTGCSRDPVPIPEVPPIVVTGAEKPVSIGEIVTLNVTPPVFPSKVLKSNYNWLIIDSTKAPRKMWVSEDSSSVSFGTGATSGKLTAIVDASHVYGTLPNIFGDVKSPGITLVDVQVGDDHPPVPPEPPGPPTPIPTPIPPTTNDLFASYIYDSTKDIPQSIADMRAAITVGQVLKGLASVRAYDISGSDIDKLNLRQTITSATSSGKSLPLVIFQSKATTDKTAPVVSTISPTKADDVVAECKRLKGIK